MFSQTSTFNQGVDTAFLVILAICIVFLVGITAVMIYFVYKYKNTKNPTPTDVKESTKLEVIWTVIPTLLVLAMFYYGYVAYAPMREVPDGAMTVKATGRMWSFSFEYDNGKFSEKLVVPQGKPVKIDLYSPDVIHSLYIPAFRIKEDMVPGIDNYMWFQANEVGEYDLFCAEYCGTDHAKMITKTVVLPAAEFDTWYNTKEVIENAEQAGLLVLKKNGCIACHSTDGTKLIGNSFKGLYGATRKVTSGGAAIEIKADAEYIERSIYDPNADLVEGFAPNIMTSYKERITKEEIAQIVEYLKSVK